MRHIKGKECAWAPGTLDADVTYAGEHTRATLAKMNGRDGESTSDFSRSGKLLLALVLGAAAVAAGFWLLN